MESRGRAADGRVTSPPIPFNEPVDQTAASSGSAMVESQLDLTPAPYTAKPIGQRQCRELDGLAAALDAAFFNINTTGKVPSDRNRYQELINSIDLLRFHGHVRADEHFSNFCRLFVIPIPAPLIHYYAYLPDMPISDCLFDLAEQCVNGAITLDMEGELKPLLMALNSLDHPEIDKLFTKACKSKTPLGAFVRKAGPLENLMIEGKKRRDKELPYRTEMAYLSPAQLQEKVGQCLERKEYEKAFSAYYHIAKFTEKPAEAEAAWIEMTQMCLFGDAGRKLISPRELVQKLIQLSMAEDGDIRIRARLQLESLARHDYQPYKNAFYELKVRSVIDAIEHGRILHARIIFDEACDEEEEHHLGPDSLSAPLTSIQQQPLSLLAPDVRKPARYRRINHIVTPLMESEYPSLCAMQRGTLPMQSAGDLFSLSGVQHRHNGPLNPIALESIRPTETLLARNDRDSAKPLKARIRQWEVTHGQIIQQHNRRNPLNAKSTFFIKTLTGKTLTFENYDLSRPVSDLRLDFVEQGFPLCTHMMVYYGRTMGDNEQLHDELCKEGQNIGTATAVHLAVRENVASLNKVLSGTYIDDKGQVQPLMPGHLDSIEKIDKVLLKLRRQSIGFTAEKPMGTDEFLQLRACIARARQQLLAGNISTDTLKPDDIILQDTVASYWDDVSHCLDIYKVPFVDHQNKHIDQLITSCSTKQEVERQNISATEPSGIMCEVAFRDGRKIQVDQALLSARCSFIGVSLVSNPTDKISFEQDLSSSQVMNAFRQYLSSGDLSHIDDLPAADIVSLFSVANRYLAEELSQKCLSLILQGIKFNLFTTPEMQSIVTFISVPEIQQALEPLIELQAVEQGAGPESLSTLKGMSQTTSRTAKQTFSDGVLSLRQ